MSVNKAKLVIRESVLKVVLESRVPLKGREIAKQAGLDYKQTIDALDALHNTGKIFRHGKKLKTTWSDKPMDDAKERQIMLIEQAMRQIAKKRS